MSDEQDGFDEMLRRALRPVQPPETLAKFLAIAAAAEEHRRATGRRWFKPRGGGLLYVPAWPRVWAGGALAAVLFGGLMGEQVHRRHERAAADQEFATSMRITDEALAQTRAQLLQAGIRLDEQ
jgi:hypothetical protein